MKVKFQNDSKIIREVVKRESFFLANLIVLWFLRKAFYISELLHKNQDFLKHCSMSKAVTKISAFAKYFVLVNSKIPINSLINEL